MNPTENICITIGVIAVAAILVGGTVHGCTEYNRQWTETIQRCAQAGGTWANGACVRGERFAP